MRRLNMENKRKIVGWLCMSPLIVGGIVACFVDPFARVFLGVLGLMSLWSYGLYLITVPKP